MKKTISSKLKLNKETIASLNENSLSDIKGGALVNNAGNTGKVEFSGGCSDGCFTLHSLWNCTKTDCTNDCYTKKKNICNPPWTGNCHGKIID